MLCRKCTLARSSIGNTACCMYCAGVHVPCSHLRIQRPQLLFSFWRQACALLLLLLLALALALALLLAQLLPCLVTRP